MILTVSVVTYEYEQEFQPGKPVQGRLSMSPILQQLIGERTSRFPCLAHQRRQAIQWAGQEAFPLNTYLVTGVVTHLEKLDWKNDDREQIRFLLDCGLPITFTQSFGPSYLEDAPAIPHKSLYVGQWLAILGNLSLWHAKDEISPVNISAIALHRRIIDLEPSSKTFGQYIEWPFGERLPYDDGCWSDPPNYYDVEFPTGKNAKEENQP